MPSVNTSIIERKHRQDSFKINLSSSQNEIRFERVLRAISVGIFIGKRTIFSNDRSTSLHTRDALVDSH
jgi:hypothetical protein